LSYTFSQDSPTGWVADDIEAVAKTAQSWVSSEALGALVSRLDGPLAAIADIPALLRWSSATLDTRAGAERRDAARAQWSERWVRALLDAGDSLGLMRTAQPSQNSYDAVVILGGATTGNRLRVAMASGLMRSGLRIGQLVLLSAERPLGAHELEEEPDSAGDETEWRNLARNAALELGSFEEVTSTTGGEGLGAWRDIRYRSAGPRARLLVAPSARPERRASTADAIRFFGSRVAENDRRSTLIITSAIYAPYQFFSAAPLLLATNVRRAELVGTPTSCEGDSTLLAQRLAQEIHAAISAAQALLSPRA
jgi:hypothetical protein